MYLTKKIAFALLFTLSVVTLQAQKMSEGKIIYGIEVESDEINEQQKAMMPKETTTYFKKDMARTEVKTGMSNMVIIMNGKEKTGYTLMDMMGNKIALKMDPTEYKKEMENDSIKVEVTSETKEIAGYKCKKAIITEPDGSKMDVYFTEDLNPEGAHMYKGLKGTLMLFETNRGPVKMKMTAKSVTAEKVDDSQFVIPKDYQVKTREEMMKMFQKGSDD